MHDPMNDPSREPEPLNCVVCGRTTDWEWDEDEWVPIRSVWGVTGNHCSRKCYLAGAEYAEYRRTLRD